VDVSNGEGRSIDDGGAPSPKAKRARPSPRVKNPAAAVPQNDLMPSVQEFSHQTTSSGVTHMVPQVYTTHIQPPTAPMNYAPPLQVAPPILLPPMPAKLLPPKHDTVESLTGYLSYITTKPTTSSAPLISTSFTLPWYFRIPRESITVPTTPGGKSIPIRDLLFRLTLRNEADVSNGQDGEDKQENKEMEALVSMARKSMDVQNCLTEVAMSLVKVVQGVDGFVYAMIAASRVPVLPGDHVDGASQGLLGGNWDITFVCTCSEEAKTLPEQANVVSSGESAEAQAGKQVACQGRIVIGFLEQEETVILKYRHCALHRPSGEIIHHYTPAERTIVGGVVSRKAPNPPVQPQQQHPNGTPAYPPSNLIYPQQQSHDYVLVNGQWYYPQHTPAAPGHYSQPQQTSPPRVAHQQYQGVTHPDPLPDDSMAQIYSAAMAQYSAPSRRKGRSGSISDASHSHGDASTEQRLLEQLSRELAGHPQQHTQQGVDVKTEPGQVHHEGHGQEQQQGYEYPVGYTYPSTTTYTHSAVTPLAAGADLGNRSGEVGGGGADGEGDTNMGGQEEQGHGGHEQVSVSSVDPGTGVKELVQQLVQQAQAGAGPNGAAAAVAVAVAAAATTAAASPPPPGSESPETRRRRGRASKS